LAAEPAVAATAKAVIAWMKANADRLCNDAPSFGLVAVEFDVGSETCALMRPWKEGRVAICFSQLRLTPAFVELADRQELLNRLNALRSLSIRSDAAEKQTTIRLASIAADGGAKLLAVMEWASVKLRGGSAGQGELAYAIETAPFYPSQNLLDEPARCKRGSGAIFSFEIDSGCFMCKKTETSS
jgi:hypothetical protein